MTRSPEVQEAVGFEGEDLDAKIARLSAKVADQQQPARELAQAKAEKAAKAADDLQDEAAQQLLRIVRADGSAVTNYEQDGARLREAAAEYARAMDTKNARYVTICTRRHQAKALA